MIVSRLDHTGDKCHTWITRVIVSHLDHTGDNVTLRSRVVRVTCYLMRRMYIPNDGQMTDSYLELRGVRRV